MLIYLLHFVTTDFYTQYNQILFFENMKRLELLDYGRFFAALAVMIFHYTYAGINGGKITSIDFYPYITDFTRFGMLGVEFFFMISGYVIFYSSKNKRASQFLTSRVKRLYPSFWFAVFFTSFFAFTLAEGTMEITFKQMIVNLTMIPAAFGEKSVDGVYWTLIYEWKFYIVVFLILFFKLEQHFENIFIGWALLLFFAYISDFNFLFLKYKFAFFIAGTLLALIKETPSLKTFLSLILCFVFCVVITFLESEPTIAFISSCIVASFFLFFLFLNSKRGKSLTLPKSYILGALSYPLYLIHAHVGYLLLSTFATENNKHIIYVLIVVLIVLTSYFIHRVIEKKYWKYWNKFFHATVEYPISLIEQKMYPEERTPK